MSEPVNAKSHLVRVGEHTSTQPWEQVQQTRQRKISFSINRLGLMAHGRLSARPDLSRKLQDNRLFLEQHAPGGPVNAVAACRNL